MQRFPATLPVRLPTLVGVELEGTNVTPSQAFETMQRHLQGEELPIPDDEYPESRYLRDRNGDTWKSKPDETAAFELNSPPMRYVSHVSALTHVAAAIQRERKAIVGRRNGLHVHYDLSGLHTHQAVYWVALLHHHWPFIFRAFHVWEQRKEYCAPMDSARVGLMIDAPPASLEELADVFGDTLSARYHFVNTRNLEPGGIKTGEVRCFNGTFEATPIRMAIAVGLAAYVRSSAQLSGPPRHFSEGIDNPAQFAADFGLTLQSPLLRYMIDEGSRGPNLFDQIALDPHAFKNFTEAERDELPLAMAAVQGEPTLLEYVGPTVALNDDLVMLACRGRAEAMKVAHPVYRSPAKRDFLTALLQEMPEVIEFLQAMRADSALILSAAKHSAEALELCDSSLWLNVDFALAAVALYPRNVAFADQLPPHDLRKVSLAALSHSMLALQSLPAAALNDAEVGVFVVRYNASLYPHLGRMARNHPDVVVALLEQSFANVFQISREALLNPRVIQLLSQRHPHLFALLAGLVTARAIQEHEQAFLAAGA